MKVFKIVLNMLLAALQKGKELGLFKKEPSSKEPPTHNEVQVTTCRDWSDRIKEGGKSDKFKE